LTRPSIEAGRWSRRWQIAAHPDATIGMTRLAIVDVAHGHQPMANDDESIVIVYNGEVYNAPALRQDLERRGVRFRSRSDTEVILRLYEADPEHVEEHLVGMWAFAIHDRRRRRVVLSRDRFGIKPLFIADAGDAFAFASELRCFDRRLDPFSRLFSIDYDSAHAMVSWSYVPENCTPAAASHPAECGSCERGEGNAHLLDARAVGRGSPRAIDGRSMRTRRLPAQACRP
jgi:asparagine synthase (glutamine-hydrolysing)